MTNQQLYLAIGIPMLFNAALIGVVFAFLNAKLEGLEERFNAKLEGLEGRFEERFNAMDRRFDDMRDLWRSELHRVEEVLDARLKHFEQR